MSKIILKTNDPGKTASILFDVLETEEKRLKYSLSLAKKRLKKFEKNIMFHRINLLLNGVLKI